ncbi:MAG: hypothetical protein C4306_03220 [Thermoleophilia bacterium]|mgnify:CR=1 FL=1
MNASAFAWDRPARALFGRVTRLPGPWPVLFLLLVGHWVALAVFSSAVPHNGWLFYQGGDQIWYWTTSWLLAHGSVALTPVAQGWSLLLLPFAALGGPGFLAGLPGAILLQALVLAPLAVWAVYEIGARVGGRAVGYLASFLWTFGPYLAIPFFSDRYHEKYVHQFLPHPLGLTAMADYAGTVFLLLAAAFCLRALDDHGSRAALLAGLAAGFAGLVKPSTLIFLAAPTLLFLAARRGRQLLSFALALAPALGALALWKYQTLGYLPAFQAQPQARLAFDGGVALEPYRHYVRIDWHHLDVNLQGLAENFFSLRALQWLPFAGAVAAWRGSLARALFLCAWFWPFFILKGSSQLSSVDSGSFFRFLLPAVPPLVVLAAALPLLVPVYGPSLARRLAPPPPRPVSRILLLACAIVLAVFPLAAAAAVSPLRDARQTVRVASIGLPVDAELGLQAQARGRSIVLRWEKPPTSGSRVFYKLFRARGPVDHTCGGEVGAVQCDVYGQPVRITRVRFALDRPGRGTWTYRVGVAANYLDDPALGDVFLLSPPVTIAVSS